MISVATFSILTGLGGSIVFNIDKILINQILGLSDTGVYTIAFFFSTLIIIPSRPLLRIAGTLIADAFKRDDIAYIDDIYRRSCINQFIIGTFLFGGIWINIDNILIILGPVSYTHLFRHSPVVFNIVHAKGFALQQRKHIGIGKNNKKKDNPQIYINITEGGYLCHAVNFASLLY